MRPHWLGVMLLVSGVVLTGCGGDVGVPGEQGSAGLSPEPVVSISGNVIGADQASGSILVFAYPDLPAEADPAQAAPSSIAVVDPDGRFVLDSPGAASLTVVFLLDNAEDGAVDTGDPVAVLDDPENKLSGLSHGGEVTLSDVQIDVGAGRAVAAGFDLVAADQPSPPATGDPQD